MTGAASRRPGKSSSAPNPFGSRTLAVRQSDGSIFGTAPLVAKTPPPHDPGTVRITHIGLQHVRRLVPAHVSRILNTDAPRRAALALGVDAPVVPR